VSLLFAIKDRVRRFIEAAVSNCRVAGPDDERILRTPREEIRYESAFLKDLALRDVPVKRIRDVGYRVFSQFDEDGIIQWLIRQVEIPNETFIEIGVEDYRESNTRYLLEKSNWKGLILDGDGAAETYLAVSRLRGWFTIDFKKAFVTVDNVNELLAGHAGDIGLLSIDVDGVDYHLWKAVKVVSPRIVIIEYQMNFGPEKQITVPYRADFERRQHHYSMLCAGVSLAALVELGNQLGYRFVGTSSGYNAFFVREDVAGSLPVADVKQEYREPRYRDSRDAAFNNTFITELADKQRAMRDAIVLDLADGKEKTVGQVFGV
jgi:hypothetical protein